MRGGGLWASACALALAAVGASAGQLGCVSIVYQCETHGDCRSSDSGSCERSGYCSYVDDTCPDGRRYSVYAADGYAGACVQDDLPPAASGASSGTSTAGPPPTPQDPGSTTGGGGDSAATTGPADPSTTTSASGFDSGGSDTEPTLSGSTSDSGGLGECIDFDAGSGYGVVALGSTSDEDNDWDPSCGTDGLGDYIVVWTAPVDGHYHFTADSPGGDPLIAAIDTCEGAEVGCHRDIGDSNSDAQLQFDLLEGEQVILVIEGEQGDIAFELDVFTH